MKKTFIEIKRHTLQSPNGGLAPLTLRKAYNKNKCFVGGPIMKTERHWEVAQDVDAFRAANQIALDMQEHAKNKGYDHKSIRVMDKRDAHYSGLRHVDSLITWEKGPRNWAYLTDVVAENVHVEPLDGNTLSFYQM